MGSARMARISDLMIAEISAILLRKVKDPRVKHVTVADVEVSKDLKKARVFFSVLMDDIDKAEVLAGLNRAAGFIRSELFHKLRLKSIPTLTFEIDPSIEYGAHINELLHRIRDEKEEDEEREA
jgi:ribosome-binding factor A